MISRYPRENRRFVPPARYWRAVRIVLRDRRRDLDLTQCQAALLIDRSRQMLREWESGEHFPPMLSFLQWCKGLDIHPADVFEAAEIVLDEMVT